MCGMRAVSLAGQARLSAHASTAFTAVWRKQSENTNRMRNGKSSAAGNGLRERPQAGPRSGCGVQFRRTQQVPLDWTDTWRKIERRSFARVGTIESTLSPLPPPFPGVGTPLLAQQPHSLARMYTPRAPWSSRLWKTGRGRGLSDGEVRCKKSARSSALLGS